MARSALGISACQQKYSLDLLQDLGLLGAKPVTNPVDTSHKLNHESKSSLLSNPTSFDFLTGKLLYLTHTHPGVSFLFAD